LDDLAGYFGLCVDRLIRITGEAEKNGFSLDGFEFFIEDSVIQGPGLGVAVELLGGLIEDWGDIAVSAAMTASLVMVQGQFPVFPRLAFWSVNIGHDFLPNLS
jgi:hypothetical protein